MSCLPVELERYILLFVVYDDHKETLLSFAAVSTRFRALALPLIFETLPPLSLNKRIFMDKRPFSSFFRAYQSSDPHSIALARHIRKATLAFTDRCSVFEWPEPIRMMYANEYISSLVSLPHLVSLALSNVVFDPNLLGRLLSNSLTSLTIKATRSSLTARKLLGDAANIIFSHGHGLTHLDIQGHPLVHSLLSSNQDKTLPSLTHFAIRHTFVHTPDLESFLHRTPGIRRLELDLDTSLPAPCTLASDALPHLSHLTCPESWFPSFLDSDASRPITSCTTIESRNLCQVDAYEDDWSSGRPRESAPLSYVTSLKKLGTTCIQSMRVSLTMAMMDWSHTTPKLDTFSLRIPLADHTNELFDLVQHSIPKLGQGTGKESRTWDSVSDFEFLYDHYHSPRRRDLQVECIMGKKVQLPDDGIGLDLEQQEALLPLVLGPFPNAIRVQLSPYVLWTRRLRDNIWTPNVRQ